MVKVIFLFDTSCSNCGNKAKFTCSNCGTPLCGRCKSREKTDVLSNVIVPAGLCKECVNERLDNFYEGNMNTLSESVIIYANPLDSAPKSSKYREKEKTKY